MAKVLLKNHRLSQRYEEGECRMNSTFIKLVSFLLLAGLESGCTSSYTEDLSTVTDKAIFIPFGASPGLRTTKVDGKFVGSLNGAILLIPGKHTFSLQYAAPSTSDSSGFVTDVANVEIVLVLSARHTYIPVSVVDYQNRTIQADVKDFGADFPKKCLPLEIIFNEKALTNNSVVNCINRIQIDPI